MPSHHHRSGGLRQSNKKNKRSIASKRSINRASGGRVNVKTAASVNLFLDSKANRRHHAQQRRDASRQMVLQKRRGMMGGVPPPRIVGIISLAEQTAELEERVRSFALKTSDQIVMPSKATVTAKYNIHKKDGTLTFLTSSSSRRNEDDGVLAALDLCRICDVVLFVIDGNGPNSTHLDPLGMHIGGDESVSTRKTSQTTQEWDHLISSTGDSILSAAKAQGLPTVVTVLAHTVTDESPHEENMTAKSTKSIRRSALKRKLDLRKYMNRFAETEFGADNCKVVEVDLTANDDAGDDKMEEEEEEEDGDDLTMKSPYSSAAALIRTLCNMSASPPKWVSDAQRPYLVSDSFVYSTDKQELALSGFIRGKTPWDINALVHIPNMGTFACHGVQKARSPFSHADVEAAIVHSDPLKRESLDVFAKPDALQGEQNLVGFDEEMEDDIEEEEVARPAGWSDYQSTWLDGVDDMSHGADDYDFGELAKELNQKKSSSASVGGMDLDDDDNDVSPEERQALVEQRRKTHKEDLEFPDEVNAPEGMKASDRFARYRSLKSFRKSFWDPKESLPDDYASIYHFKSFKATQRDIKADVNQIIAAANATNGFFWGNSPLHAVKNLMQEENEEVDDLLEGCVPSGAYVTLFVEQVSAEAYARIASQGVICAVGLLPHENKVSVLHMGLCQSQGCDPTLDIPVKSKDILIMRCGWRTWKARPTFSQNNLNSDKHKYERYLPQGGAFFAASAYGPVTYTPCPVLVFREQNDSSEREMVAVGSILTADADRIVVKRIVLTGFPVRVHKRHATVKYMFHNPDDVRWFKPAGLYTKHGLNGNIISSSGEHGTMKCLFNAPIKQHDTVCLPLYKRIYPKFANSTPTSRDGATVKSAITKEALLIL